MAGAGAGKTETMAARVVWLVANGLVDPEQVLGLTFTRKAAQQLTARIRKRLAKLAGSALVRDLDPSGSLRSRILASEPEVSTYHAYAGRLLSEHGLLLPIEPSATLLSETELWQLAYRVVSAWDDDLDTDRNPASITESVLALSGQLAEHLVEPADLREAHTELDKLIHTLPAGRNSVAARRRRCWTCSRCSISGSICCRSCSVWPTPCVVRARWTSAVRCRSRHASRPSIRRWGAASAPGSG